MLLATAYKYLFLGDRDYVGQIVDEEKIWARSIQQSI